MESRPSPQPKNLTFRARLLLGLTIIIFAGFFAYVLYARGVFEATQKLTLISENAEGVSIGMDLTFSGFPIGRVSRIELGEDGRARIEIYIPLRDARWLKRSSIFTLERGIVGSARIRAFTGNLQDEPLPDGAERNVLRGDTSEEIPRMVATLRNVLQNLEDMSGTGGSLQASLGNVKAVTERMAGKGGALSAVLGGDDEARKVVAAIDRANALLAQLGGVTQRLDGVLGRTDSMLGKTDQRVFGEGGLVDGTQRAVNQANAILGEVRESLKKVDQVLKDAQEVSGNAKAATRDLGALRAEVDASLRRVNGLIEEINRKWPFKREGDIKLP